MIVFPIKTHKITTKDKSILKIIDSYVKNVKENSVLAVASNIVSICEGSVVPIGNIEKDELIKQQSQYYLPKSSSKYDTSLTITNNILTATAGIDESNAKDSYTLWPKNPQKSANLIREFISKKFKVKNFGVIITDSKTSPLRWGVTGQAIAHSGFSALKDYIGKPDVFGRNLEHTKVNIADSLAAAATFVMGEGAEQTPLSILESLPNIEFQNRNPSNEELDNLKISLDDDLYAPLLKNADWKKGEK